MNRDNEDWKHFQDNGFILKVNRINRKIEDRTIEESIRVWFGRKNREMLAHGSKNFSTQDGAVLKIPRIQRTKSINRIWQGYAM